MRSPVLACWLLGAAATAGAQVPAAPQVTPDAGASLDPRQLSALLDSAVGRLSAAARSDAERWLQQRRYPEALAALETARELDPRDAESTRMLAELELTLGRVERAERLYRALIELAPERTDALLALGDLLARDRDRPERLAEAAALYARAQEQQGESPEIVLRKARLAAERGAFEEAEEAYLRLARSPLDGALLLELGDFYRDLGRPDEAATYYGQVSGALAKAAEQRLFELEVDKEARRYGFAQRDRSVDAALREIRRNARVLAGRGQLKAAESSLREALGRAPERAELRADLADVLREAGRSAEAELEYLRAIALDGSQPEVHLRLAELYLAAEPVRASEAVYLLERTIASRPDWLQPQLLLARAYRAQGDLPRAFAGLARLVALAPPGPERDEALALQASLQLALGVGASPEEPVEEPSGGAAAPRSGADHLARARTFLASGQTEAALVELRRLEGDAVLGDQALELQARVLYASGRVREAGALLAGAVERRPDRPELHELLGEVWLARRDRARARSHWLRCEAAGHLACTYRLARLDAPGRGFGAVLFDLARVPALWEARARLARLEGAAGLPVAAAEVSRLRREIDRRQRELALVVALLALSAAALAFAVRRARWGGVDLAQLIARHPQASPEVQRVLSAIRHEVLKHNTLMLAGVVDALRAPAGGDEAAAHIARALVGGDGRGGAAAQLEVYAGKLRQIARGYGERLNLRRRDAALSALRCGFAIVRSALPQLTAAGRLRSGARRRLARRLARADQLLNVEGQTALRTLLDGMRNVRLTPSLLEAVFDRVRHEPALSSAPIEPLSIDPDSDLPCSVSVPAQAFDDILANLFRNALQASLRHPEPRPVVVGLAVYREVDDITGLETAELRVRDRSPEPLDPGAVRGGYIEAGLGLTADLVARHDGQLAVHAPEPGFNKAVVLRLPMRRSDAP